MGLIEWLFKLKHNYVLCSDKSGAHLRSEIDTHSFDPVEPNELGPISPENGEFRLWSYKNERVAVKYQESVQVGKIVDKSDPTVVPYSDVKTIWTALSGQQYHLLTVYREYRGDCDCGHTDVEDQPVRYIALHCGNVVADETDRSALDEQLIEHDREVREQ